MNASYKVAVKYYLAVVGGSAFSFQDIFKAEREHNLYRLEPLLLLEFFYMV